jgi:Protein of unknown function (DUF2934)
MLRTLIASVDAIETKTHRSVATASKKAARTFPTPTASPDFDAAVYRKEIAQVAYRIWLERADRPGSPEEDWLKADSEVRAKYTR